MFQSKNNKAQIAMEFLILAGIGFFILFTMLIILSDIGSSKLDENTFTELDDFMRGLQQEFIVAAEMEVGFHRYLNIPTRVNGLEYEVFIFEVDEYRAALILEFKGVQQFYMIPKVSGILSKGDIVIQKTEEGLLVT